MFSFIGNIVWVCFLFSNVYKLLLFQCDLHMCEGECIKYYSLRKSTRPIVVKR